MSMKTYYLDVAGSSKNIIIKAENISNLRKKLIREYDADMKRGHLIYVKVLVGPKYGSHYEEVGCLYYRENQAWRYDSTPSGYYWTSYVSGKNRRVSPKTGNLLDVDPGRTRYSRVPYPSNLSDVNKGQGR